MELSNIIAFICGGWVAAIIFFPKKPNLNVLAYHLASSALLAHFMDTKPEISDVERAMLVAVTAKENEHRYLPMAEQIYKDMFDPKLK